MSTTPSLLAPRPPLAALLPRAILVVVFGGSAVLKLLAGPPASQLRAHWLGVVSSPTAFYGAILLELLAVALLASRRWGAGVVLCTVLALGFSAYIHALQLTGVGPKACGCFGRIQVPYLAHSALLVGVLILCWSAATARTGGEAPGRSELA